MKKTLFIFIVSAITFTTAFGQTQRTSRTNSRSHYPPDTTRAASSRIEVQTDADRNNPPADKTKQQNTNTNQNTNKPDNTNTNTNKR